MPGWVADQTPTVSALLAFLIALAFVAFVGTPASSWLARRLGVLDAPGGRHIHDRPIPLLGGVGIVVGIVVAFVVALVVAGATVAFVGLT